MRSILIISSLYSQTQHVKALLARRPDLFRLIGSADNSVLGMSLIESTQPDVVIMPVYMNFWNAEDLINYLLPRGISPKFILLHDGAELELSEPVRSRVLAVLPQEFPSEDMLLDALAHLPASGMEQRNMLSATYNPLVQHSMEVMELLMGLSSSRIGAAQAEFGRLRVGNRDCWVLLGKPNDGRNFFSEFASLERAFASIIQLLEPLGRSEVCIYRDSDLCILLEGGQEREPDWATVTDQINRVIGAVGIQPLLFEISDMPLPLERWHSQCRELLRLRQDRFFYSPLFLQPKTMLTYRIPVTKNQILEKLSALSVALQSRQHGETGALLRTIENMVSHSLSQEIYAFVFAQLMMQYSRLYYSSGVGNGSDMFDVQFRQFSSVHEVFDDFRRMFSSLYTRLDTVRHGNETIAKICSYINQNLSTPLTLEVVAKQVHISPTYLSRLFKKETGCSYNVYVNQQRVQRAAQLLGTSHKIIDIAGMVGFDNAKYFSQVFKKQLGKTPQQYRQALQREESL